MTRHPAHRLTQAERQSHQEAPHQPDLQTGGFRVQIRRSTGTKWILDQCWEMESGSKIQNRQHPSKYPRGERHWILASASCRKPWSQWLNPLRNSTFEHHPSKSAL
jgi:hypothetical protein